MKNRSKLRAEAKKIYKEQVKARGIPKRQRIPFSQFFKQYLELQKKQKQVQEPEAPVETNEDFDFENMVNMNEISDEDIEVSEGEEEES